MNRVALVCLSLGLAGLAAPVSAQYLDNEGRLPKTANPRAEPIRNMPFVEAPTPADVAAAYPVGVSGPGSSTLTCVFRMDGTLTRCRPAERKTGNDAFDQAAIKLASKFRAPRKAATGPGGMAVVDIGGLSTTLTIAFPVRGPDGKAVMGDPRFFRKPTAETYMAEFAQAPLADDFKRGEATLNCKVGTKYALTDCTVSGETPTGQGVGDAALRLSRYYAVLPWTPEGLPVIGAPVTIPIKFALSQ
jgi:hypothetical protein